jgi:hypothetical protein
MNLLRVIEDFREELAYLDEAIIALVKLAHKRARKKGRPPLWTRPSVIAETQNLNGRNGPGSKGRRRDAGSGSAAS